MHPPSSVSSITSGSKSSGTPVGSSDLSGCLRSFFTCAPLMRKHPLSQYRSRDGLRFVVIKLFGLHFSSSQPSEPRSQRARSCSSTSARPRVAQIGRQPAGDYSALTRRITTCRASRKALQCVPMSPENFHKCARLHQTMLGSLRRAERLEVGRAG